MKRTVAKPSARGVSTLVVTLAATAALAGFGTSRAVKPQALQLNQSISTPPVTAHAVCPALPVVQATSSDKAFSAGAGVVRSTVRAVALAATIDTLTLTPGLAADDPAKPAPKPADQAGALLTGAAPAGDHPLILAATPQQTSPLLVGVGTGLAPSGDLRGLVTAACTPPAQTSWLLGGATGPGVGSRVVVTNTGSETTVVSIDVLTPTGWLHPAVGRDLSLGAGHSRDVLLRALVPAAVTTLAVQVNAKGADVHAQLVDQRVQGTDPAGVAVVTGSLPAKQLVLLGITGAKGEAGILRLVNPGKRAASVGWRLEDGDGALGTPKGTTVPGGGVLDVPMPTAPGPVALVLDSDQPVLAGLQVTTTEGAAVQRSWVPGYPGTAQPLWIAVPDGVTSSLLVASPGSQVTVHRFTAAGTTLPDVHLDTGAGGVLTLPASALAGVVAVQLVAGSGHPAVAVLATSSGALRALAATPPISAWHNDVTLQPAPDGSWP